VYCSRPQTERGSPPAKASDVRLIESHPMTATGKNIKFELEKLL